MHGYGLFNCLARHATPRLYTPLLDVSMAQHLHGNTYFATGLPWAMVMSRDVGTNVLGGKSNICGGWLGESGEAVYGLEEFSTIGRGVWLLLV